MRLMIVSHDRISRWLLVILEALWRVYKETIRQIKPLSTSPLCVRQFINIFSSTRKFMRDSLTWMRLAAIISSPTHINL